MRYVALGVSLILGYLIGSLNTSVIVGRCMGVDVRSKGSGNAGATNTLRTLGKKAAAIVLLGDLAKAVLAVLVGLCIGKFAVDGSVVETFLVEGPLSPFASRAGAGGSWVLFCQYLAGLGAVLGHNFPLYFGFRGGKGILTSFGVILMLDWKIALIVLACSVLVMAVTRYVSLGSLVGAVLFPVLVAVFNWHNPYPHVPYYIAFAVVLGLLAIFQHRANLKRLLAGTESKLFAKTKKGDA